MSNKKSDADVDSANEINNNFENDFDLDSSDEEVLPESFPTVNTLKVENQIVKTAAGLLWTVVIDTSS